jgi:hypothetical protein
MNVESQQAIGTSCAHCSKTPRRRINPQARRRKRKSHTVVIWPPLFADSRAGYHS